MLYVKAHFLLTAPTQNVIKAHRFFFKGADLILSQILGPCSSKNVSRLKKTLFTTLYSKLDPLVERIGQDILLVKESEEKRGNKI